MQSLIASIMFADLIGSSKVKDDKLKAILTEKFERYKKVYLNNKNHFFYKGLGDGALICSFDHLDLAEIALKIRDDIKNTDWKKLGFEENIGIRIGINLSKINLKYENNKVSDVFGKGVDTAARIEPIAEENSVFVSKRFYDFLSDENTNVYRTIPLGLLPLAKNYGELEIFKLLRGDELDESHNSVMFDFMVLTHSPSESEIPIPKLKVEFNQEEKNSFVSASFLDIKKYFKTAIYVLKEKIPDAEVSFIDGVDDKFACKIFYKDELICKCKIWLRDKFSAFTSCKSICYSDNYLDMATDNKFNYWATIDDNGDHVFLNISSMGKFNNREGFINTNVNSKKTAEIFWLSFIKPFNKL
ncbi:MAG TPA: adenylate/guanylate cyclase domain-containing protein [Melioribacteraceae bacterium]|nr:adenylate/guanylate cyclase domain-containing protein [Melioribacteraceae bacterium]